MKPTNLSFDYDVLYDHGGVTMTFISWADSTSNYEVHHWNEDTDEWTFVAEAIDPNDFDRLLVNGRPRLVARNHFLQRESSGKNL